MQYECTCSVFKSVCVRVCVRVCESVCVVCARYSVRKKRKERKREKRKERKRARAREKYMRGVSSVKRNTIICWGPSQYELYDVVDVSSVCDLC